MKKTILALVSLFLIAGMAAQSFATNVDFSAFVTKDEYDAEYYALDWRIKDIDLELQRLYKFTCTNVVSFGGSNAEQSNVSPALFYKRNTTATYHWYANPIADLSEEGYLRFNTADQINQFGSHGKVDRYYLEIPAALCKWRDGIVPAPNCSIRVDLTRTWPNTTARGGDETGSTIEFVMGPFRKLPKFTSTGSTKTTGLFGQTDRLLTSSSYLNDTGRLYYAYGTETRPTSWTADSAGRMYIGTWGARGNDTQLYETRTISDIESNPYDKLNGVYRDIMYWNVVPTTDFSQYENVWIRITTPTNTAINLVRYAAFMNFNLTSWNNNK